MLINSLSEAQKRWYIGQKAIELGRGGIAQMHELTGLSENTIRKAMRELKSGKPLKMNNRTRIKGGGRKKVEKENPEIAEALYQILDENTAGNPMGPLRWTRKTCRTLAS